jgi:hypothetical protein
VDDGVPLTVSVLQALQSKGPIYGRITKFQHMLGFREVPFVTMDVHKSVLKGEKVLLMQQ